MCGVVWVARKGRWEGEGKGWHGAPLTARHLFRVSPFFRVLFFPSAHPENIGTDLIFAKACRTKQKGEGGRDKNTRKPKHHSARGVRPRLWPLPRVQILVAARGAVVLEEGFAWGGRKGGVGRGNRVRMGVGGVVGQGPGAAAAPSAGSLNPQKFDVESRPTDTHQWCQQTCCALCG